MAQKIGAAEFKDGWVMGISPVSYKRELNNTLRTKNVFKDDVFVNQDGKRFVKEDLPYIRRSDRSTESRLGYLRQQGSGKERTFV